MRRYSDAEIENAVSSSTSMAGVLRALNVPTGSAGSRENISRRVTGLGLDTGHFSGASRGGSASKRREPVDIFVVRSFSEGRDETRYLRRALLEVGVPYECSECSLHEWRGRAIRIEVDHINGDPLDNRRRNLRFLCPNCHSLTSQDASQRVGMYKTNCVDCGKSLSRSHRTRCQPCANKALGIARRGSLDLAAIAWPSTAEIVELVELGSWTSAALSLGVSDNAIRKHLREYGDGAWPRRGHKYPKARRLTASVETTEHTV